jgi:hypothetical protein
MVQGDWCSARARQYRVLVERLADPPGMAIFYARFARSLARAHSLHSLTLAHVLPDLGKGVREQQHDELGRLVRRAHLAPPPLPSHSHLLSLAPAQNEQHQDVHDGHDLLVAFAAVCLGLHEFEQPVVEVVDDDLVLREPLPAPSPDRAPDRAVLGQQHDGPEHRHHHALVLGVLPEHPQERPAQPQQVLVALQLLHRADPVEQRRAAGLDDAACGESGENWLKIAKENASPAVP